MRRCFRNSATARRIASLSEIPSRTFSACNPRLSSGDMKTQYRCIVDDYARVYTSVNVSMLQDCLGRQGRRCDPLRSNCELSEGTTHPSMYVSGLHRSFVCRRLLNAGRLTVRNRAGRAPTVESTGREQSRSTSVSGLFSLTGERATLKTAQTSRGPTAEPHSVLRQSRQIVLVSAGPERGGKCV